MGATGSEILLNLPGNITEHHVNFDGMGVFQTGITTQLTCEEYGLLQKTTQNQCQIFCYYILLLLENDFKIPGFHTPTY